MDREQLLRETQTTQVRILACERLADGQIHTRKDIIDYIVQCSDTMHLPRYREGHLAGGIRQALTNMNCEALGRAKFRATVSLQEPSVLSLSLSQRAAQACQAFREQMISLSRETDYVNASEEEMRELEKLKKFVQSLKECQYELEH